MPDQPIRVEIVSHPGRKELLSALFSLVTVGMILAAQWYVTTPEPERIVKLRSFGVSRCREGRWHFRGALLAWPPHQCPCFWPEGWPVQSDPESQAKADRAESASLGQEK